MIRQYGIPGVIAAVTIIVLLAVPRGTPAHAIEAPSEIVEPPPGRD